MLPPTSVTRASAASARNPSISASMSASGNESGSPSDRSVSRGVPPIAAMSERLTASAFQPMSDGELKRRSKWTSSTSASVVRISSAPRGGSTTAASSPIGTVSQEGGAPRRARMAAIRPRSPRTATTLPGVLDGPGFTDHGDFDLAGILELVLDPLGDVFRQPHRRLVGHAVAFDDDADLAAGL